MKRRRNVLLLYPGEVAARRELIERERRWLGEIGVGLILADDWIAPGEGELFDDCVEVPPAEQVELAVGALEAHARQHRIDGVIVQHEAAVPAGTILAGRLSLPGPPAWAALRCVAKHMTRAELARAGVSQPAYRLADDAEDVIRFGESHGWPVVLKGTASAMARLVTRVDAPEEASGAVEGVRNGLSRSIDVMRLRSFARTAGIELGCDPTRTFLVEAFADGVPLEVDGVAGAGGATAFGVIEQVLAGSTRFYFSGYLLEADLADDHREAARRTAIDAVSSLGLAACGFCVELRGRGREAAVIEVNGRFPEDRGMHRLFEAACGQNPFHACVQLALGEDVRATPARGIRHALAYRCGFAEGIVRRVPTAAELLEWERRTGLECGLCVKVGDETHAPPHPDTFPHLAWVLASDDLSSRAAYLRASDAAKGLQVDVEPLA